MRKVTWSSKHRFPIEFNGIAHVTNITEQHSLSSNKFQSFDAAKVEDTTQHPLDKVVK